MHVVDIPFVFDYVTIYFKHGASLTTTAGEASVVKGEIQLLIDSAEYKTILDGLKNGPDRARFVIMKGEIEAEYHSIFLKLSDDGKFDCEFAKVYTELEKGELVVYYYLEKDCKLEFLPWMVALTVLLSILIVGLIVIGIILIVRRSNK